MFSSDCSGQETFPNSDPWLINATFLARKRELAELPLINEQQFVRSVLLVAWPVTRSKFPTLSIISFILLQ
jgi:hypothetical protein